VKARTRVVLLAVAAALLGVLFVVPATPAMAVGCYGTGCAGRDPNTMGCGADAYSPVTTVVGNVFVELRHSWACGASWTRIQNANAKDKAYIKNSIGSSYTTTVGSGQSAVWTLMVANMNANYWAQACGLDEHNNAGDDYGCTGQW
jgi:hypothetical protein